MTEYCAERPPPRPCDREWVEENFPEMAVPLADPRLAIDAFDHFGGSDLA